MKRLRPGFLILPALFLIVLATSAWLGLQVDDAERGFFHVTLPEYFDGLPVDHYTLETHVVQENEFLGSLLYQFGVPATRHYPIVEACRAAFNVRAIRDGQRFYVFRDPQSCDPEYLIYEPSPYRSYQIRLLGEPQVEEVTRPVKVETCFRKGDIQTSLWDALIDGQIPPALISQLEDALECAVDFHHLQTGDHFRVMYEEDHLDGQRIGLGMIRAVEFVQQDSVFAAFYFAQDSIQGFYNDQGRPMRSIFLKAPVRFSRISSRFSRSRFHPILKVRRPHLGTDYAAPYGTEIVAVGDGTVTEATRRGGNGKYVKIRHNGTYETQYLHMQRFAKGIRPGVRVRQGQVIGYVGSTGLATGPHVCFRFWKNGRQVNHLRERLPEAKPMPADYLPAFNQVRDSLRLRLDKGPYPDKPEIDQRKAMDQDMNDVAGELISNGNQG